MRLRCGRLSTGALAVVLVAGAPGLRAGPTPPPSGAPPPGLAGNATPALAVTPPGIAIAATGTPYRHAVPVVLHNGTSATARGLEVTVAARAPTGGRLARGRTRDVAPADIRPGGVALAVVPLQHGNVSPGATIATAVTRKPGSGTERATLDVERLELSPPMTGPVAQRLTGRVRSREATAGAARVVVVCFDEASRPATWGAAITPGGPLEAGKRVAFVVEFADLCPSYLVGATAPTRATQAGGTRGWGIAGVIAIVVLLFGGLTVWLRPRRFSASRPSR